MHKLSDIAIQECVAELRAASRRPIEQVALDTIVGWLRPQFERILDRVDGGKRWALHGQRVREKSRHIGALADFFGNHADVATVSVAEMTHAVRMAKADCTVRSARVPLAYEYCSMAPVDSTAAEDFLRAIELVPERADQAAQRVA
ncbi:MAG TPA: hypothetical protein VI485_14715 [Vicinamibacterales bacterium]|nr:hypothetical protein [Vicinamibacterales bacterium]